MLAETRERMHAHAIQFDPNLLLKELYALQRGAANKRAEEVRRKLRFASVLGVESTFGAGVEGMSRREGSEGEARGRRGEDEWAFGRERKLSASRPAGGSFSGWA
jgi:hypothetical protein